MSLVLCTCLRPFIFYKQYNIYAHTLVPCIGLSDTQQSMELAMHILVMSSYELIEVRLAPPNLCCLDKQQIGDKYWCQ